MTNDQGTPSMVAGRYRLDQLIAVGGMASVHRAVDTVLDRPVAVKILHDQFASDPAFVARFKREAQAAARLSSPKVVAVYDWGSHGDTYYIAMELIDGRTLAQELTETGPLDIDAAIGIALDVTSALAAAHDQGTIHRDIKPSNIIVGPAGGAKVADFGIARALQVQGDGDLTDAGSVIGTAGYLSPEQARGAPIDPRSDLYSLGVVLFEMVAGRRPFVGTSPLAVLHQHIDNAPPSIRELRPSVPVNLAQLIEELLSKDPDDRPATARALAERLRSLRDAHRRAPMPDPDQTDATGTDATGLDMARTAVFEAGSASAQDEPLPPTAVMPPAVRPDARRVDVAPPSDLAPPSEPPRGSRSGWLIAVGAVAVAGLVVLLLFAGQLLGGDGSGDVSDTSSTETTAPASTVEPADETIVVPEVQGSSQADAEAETTTTTASTTTTEASTTTQASTTTEATASTTEGG